MADAMVEVLSTNINVSGLLFFFLNFLKNSDAVMAVQVEISTNNIWRVFLIMPTDRVQELIPKRKTFFSDVKKKCQKVYFSLTELVQILFNVITCCPDHPSQVEHKITP